MTTATAPQSTAERLVADLQMPANLFATDIQSMPAEMLSDLPGGKARCGYDLIFEVSSLNHYIAKRARGEEATLEMEGWVKAPESYRNKEVALADFQDSVSALSQALLTATEEQLTQNIPTPFGDRPITALAGIARSHIMYHSGQLNYIQTLHGDDAFHWAD